MKLKWTVFALMLSLLTAPSIAFAAEADDKAKAKATSDQDPEEILSGIERDFFRERDPVKQAKVLAAAKKDFLEKFPKDPLRWKLRLLDAVAAARSEAEDSEKQAKTILTEVVEASDASEEVRARANGFLLSFIYSKLQEKKATLDEFKDSLMAHLKKFPKFEENSFFTRWYIEAIVALDEAGAQKKIEALTKSEYPALAEVAEQQLEKVKTMSELKTKPLDIKFTSVDGKEIDLSKMRGKVVLIDFWATWCGPCMVELPNVVAAYKKLNSKGFEIIGLSFDQDKEKLLSVTKAKEMTWPQYFDGKGWQNKFGQRFGIDSIPTMWLVDKKGMLVSMEAREGLEERVEKLLKQE
ncbi:MAG: TlpA family protein disulfide reductase [Verrucomicrobiales bacterium]|nr:TlpA family protein disulfide reductase [Verrucomicrobiales bacterium]